MVAHPHVPIPGGNIQISIQRIMIITIIPAHKIVRDPSALAYLQPQLVDLQALKFLVTQGEEPLEFQHQSRVMRTNWQGDLVP